MEPISSSVTDMMVDVSNEFMGNTEALQDEINTETLQQIMDTCEGIVRKHIEAPQEEENLELLCDPGTKEGYLLQLRLIESSEDMSTMEKLSEIRKSDSEHLLNEQTAAQIKTMLEDNKTKNNGYVMLAEILVALANIALLCFVKNPTLARRISQTCRLLIA